jgi:hypothetical protein
MKFAKRLASCAVRSAGKTNVTVRSGRSRVHDGDELVAVKLDRLGRSTRDVLNLVHELEAKGTALTVLEPAFSTKDAAGPILVTVLGMVAEMERKFIRERQQAGIEAAKAKASTRAASHPFRSRGCVRCATLGRGQQSLPRPSGSAG